jgi:hypothetical protein
LAVSPGEGSRADVIVGSRYVNWFGLAICGECLVAEERSTLFFNPLFRLSARDHGSTGCPWRAGESVIFVDGDGTWIW